MPLFPHYLSSKTHVGPQIINLNNRLMIYYYHVLMDDTYLYFLLPSSNKHVTPISIYRPIKYCIPRHVEGRITKTALDVTELNP